MGRVIIFDSPDGTGKTEISKGLSKVLGVPYFRMDTQHDNWRKGKFKEALEFDQTYLASFLRQTGTSVIIDRAYPSEWVYSRVFDRPTNDAVLRKVDDEFAAMGATIIVPLRHDYSANREDEVVDRKHLPMLHETYLEFVEWTRCKVAALWVDAYLNNLQSELVALGGAIDSLDGGPYRKVRLGEIR